MLNLNFQDGQAPALNARNMNAIVESINTLGYAVGGPNVASTVSAMTDTSKVYVYTGSETGYTAGNWYYYNGSAWVSGGVYQATAVETDTTLTMPGEPADAKATGDAIAGLKSALINSTETKLLLAETLKNTGTAASKWFDNAFSANGDVSIVLNGISGVDTSLSEYLRVIVYYTPSGSNYVPINEIGKLYHLWVDPSKTIDHFSIVGYRASATTTSTDSSWSVTVFDGDVEIDEIDKVTKALKISESNKVVLTKTLVDASASTSKWFTVNLPATYEKLQIAYTGIGGIVDTTQTKFVRANVHYTSGNDTYVDLVNENQLYEIPIDKTRTISKFEVVLYRGATSAVVYSYVDIALYDSEYETNYDTILEMNGIQEYEYFNRAYYDSGHSSSNSRIATDLFKTDATLFLSIEPGYEYLYVTYSDLSYNNFTDTNWTTSPIAFCSDNYIGIVIKKVDGTAINPSEGSKLHIIKEYQAGQKTVDGYNGIRIDTRRNPLQVSKSTLTRTIPTGYTTQAGSIFGKYLVQGYSNSSDTSAPAYIQVFNLETDALMFGQTINVYHFGSATFSEEYYNDADPMPLLYVTGLNEHVYAVRVTESAATVIRDISIPETTCGYYQGACVDPWNNYLYVFGYAAQSYRDKTNNYLIITKYNLSNLTTANGVTTAEQIEQIKIPFIYCFQDFAFYNGKIFIASGFNTTENPSKIVVLNIAEKAIETEISISAIQTEPEMIAFRNLEKKDVLYFQAHATQYTIIDFV